MGLSSGLDSGCRAASGCGESFGLSSFGVVGSGSGEGRVSGVGGRAGSMGFLGLGFGSGRGGVGAKGRLLKEDRTLRERSMEGTMAGTISDWR